MKINDTQSNPQVEGVMAIPPGWQFKGGQLRVRRELVTDLGGLVFDFVSYFRTV